MTQDLRIGRIRGIDISVNWSLLVLVVLLTWTLASAVFPSTNPHLSHSTHLWMAFAATAGFVLSLLLHELGHALQARREGIELDGITLWLFGGVARFKSRYATAGAEFRVAFAGPLVTLLLGALFVALALLKLPQAVGAVSSWLGYINLSLFAFNMLPALPLDGGRVFHGILWKVRGDEAAATRVSANVGRAFGYLLVSGGLVLFMFQGSFSGAWLAFTGWFLLQAADAEARYALTKQAVAGLRVRDVMTRRPVTVPADLPIGRLLQEPADRHRHTTYPVVEDGHPVGLLALQSAARVPPWDWEKRRVRDCMLALPDVPVVAEDDQAADVLADLSVSEAGHALVVSDGQLVGVVAMSDLSRVLDAGPRGRQPVPA